MAAGGSRDGAGRPFKLSIPGEATTPVRIPVNLVTPIKEFLAKRAQQRILHVPPVAQSSEAQELELLIPSQENLELKIPLYGSLVSAGFPSPADDYIQDWLDLNSLLITDKPATFFIRVKGTSMIEEGIRPGDLLVVDKGITPQSGDIVIAVIDNELTVKELDISAKGTIRLLPRNKELKPIELSDGQQLLVWGVVTAMIHQFKRGKATVGGW